MRRQGGWAALLPLGLIAILGTSGVIVATEKVTGSEEGGLVARVKGDKAQREGKVTVEILEEQTLGRRVPAPGSGK